VRGAAAGGTHNRRRVGEARVHGAGHAVDDDGGVGGEPRAGEGDDRAARRGSLRGLPGPGAHTPPLSGSTHALSMGYAGWSERQKMAQVEQTIDG
jgi:hypothetical protein